MKITLDYSDNDGNERTLILRPEQYFDLNYVDKPFLDPDGLPKHDRIVDYVERPQDIAIARLSIHCEDRRFIEITTKYWDDQDSECTTIARGTGSTEDQRELVISQKLDTGTAKGWMITRIDCKSDDHWPTSSSFVLQNEDGTQKDYPADLSHLKKK